MSPASSAQPRPCPLPCCGHTPSWRQQRAGRYRWRSHRRAGTSAAPGERATRETRSHRQGRSLSPHTLHWATVRGQRVHSSKTSQGLIGQLAYGFPATAIVQKKQGRKGNAIHAQRRLRVEEAKATEWFISPSLVDQNQYFIKVSIQFFICCWFGVHVQLQG